MDLIECGWCGHSARPPACDYCGRDPAQPWEHRDLQPPTIAEPAAGRPTLEAAEVRRLYGEARARVLQTGRAPTVDNIAASLDRSPRTVREWRSRFDLE